MSVYFLAAAHRGRRFLQYGLDIEVVCIHDLLAVQIFAQTLVMLMDDKTWDDDACNREQYHYDQHRYQEWTVLLKRSGPLLLRSMSKLLFNAANHAPDTSDYDQKEKENDIYSKKRVDVLDWHAQYVKDNALLHPATMTTSFVTN